MTTLNAAFNAAQKPAPGEFTKAVKENRADVVKDLLQRGADVNEKDDDGNAALMWATCIGREEIARLLIDQGAILDEKNYGGRTALMWAAVYRCEGTVRLLLYRGASLDVKDNEGKTALKIIEYMGIPVIAQMLKDATAAEAAAKAEAERDSVLHDTAAERQTALRARAQKINVKPAQGRRSEGPHVG